MVRRKFFTNFSPDTCVVTDFLNQLWILLALGTNKLTEDKMDNRFATALRIAVRRGVGGSLEEKKKAKLKYELSVNFNQVENNSPRI